MTVYVTVSVNLQSADAAEIKAAALIKIELTGHVHHAVRPDDHTKALSSERESSGVAGFHAQMHLIQHPVLQHGFGHQFRDTYADVDDRVGEDFLHGPPGDGGMKGSPAVDGADGAADLFTAGFQNGAFGNILSADEIKITLHVGQLLLLGADDNGIHQRGRDIYHAGRNMLAFRTKDLNDDLAAGSVGRLGNGQGVDGSDLVLERDVAPVIGKTGLDEGDIHGGNFVEEPLLPVTLGRNDEFLRAFFIQPVLAAQSGIHKKVQTGFGEQILFSSGAGPDHMTQHAAGKVVSFDLIVHDCLTGIHQAGKMADDYPVHRTFADISFCLAAMRPVSETESAVHGKMAGRAGFPETPCQSAVQVNRGSAAAKGVDPDGVSVFDKADSLFHRHQFVHCMLPPVKGTGIQ